MLCICDAGSFNSTFVYKNRSTIWNCRCSKTVIPGWDQESNLWTCIVLSLAFMTALRWDPWSWPGMTCRGHSAFLVDVHFWRQKNIRTKEDIECSNVCSSGLDVHLFIQCCASEMLCLRLSFVGEGHKRDYITNNAKLSFLAGTRNLVVGLALCSRWLWWLH